MAKKIKLSTGILCILTSITLVGAVGALSNGFKEWNIKEDVKAVLYDKEDVYGDDYKRLITNVPKSVKYNVTFTNEDKSIKDVQAPTTEGKWTARIELEENILYKGAVYEKTFNYHTTSNEKIKSFFDVGTDSWGGTADNLSVKCSDKNVNLTMDTYTELMIDTNNETSGCLDSKFTMFDGTFKVMFKTNLSEYGTFAFWLTGVESEENATDEITVELCKDNEIVFGSAIGSEYKSVTKKVDSNYADEYWHSLEINYNHEETKANVKLDNKIIYTFTENIPNVEYVKPHIGLLYPTNPTWSGTKTNKNNYAYVANYEVYNTSGVAQ